jgi:ERCC4-type nuclease
MMTIVVDSREKLPYRFAGVRSKVRVPHADDEVTFLLQFGYLVSGDYSLAGLTDRVAVERKSIDDLYGTLGRGRDRFRDECERLSSLDLAAIVIEGTLTDILKRPPEHSQMRPSAVANTIVSWSRRWPRVHWWFADSRRLAEVFTYRLLEGFWRDQQRQSN